MSFYLPRYASIDDACQWLAEKTSEHWSPARFLDQQLVAWVWIDHQASVPNEIHGGRLEGYLLPMIFGGDTHRLAVDRTDALITISRTYDGRLLKIDPGIRVPLEGLRYRREDVERLAVAPTAIQDLQDTSAIDARPMGIEATRGALFEQDVRDRAQKLWDSLYPQSRPFKADLEALVFKEMVEDPKSPKPARGQITRPLVNKAMKQWKMPIKAAMERSLEKRAGFRK